VEAVIARLLEAPPHDPREHWRDGRRKLRRIIAHDGAQRRDGGLPPEGWGSRQHFVQHHTEREDVGASVDGLA
jgi:hypothetical protein